MDEAETMTITFSRALAIVAAWALLAPFATTQAQEIQLASHAEMNNLYARLAELESRIAFFWSLRADDDAQLSRNPGSSQPARG